MTHLEQVERLISLCKERGFIPFESVEDEEEFHHDADTPIREIAAAHDGIDGFTYLTVRKFIHSAKGPIRITWHLLDDGNPEPFIDYTHTRNANEQDIDYITNPIHWS